MASSGKKIIKSRAKINKIKRENQWNQKLDIWKDQQNLHTFARLIEEKKTQITKNQEWKKPLLPTNLTEIKRIIKKYYKNCQQVR